VDISQYYFRRTARSTTSRFQLKTDCSFTPKDVVIAIQHGFKPTRDCDGGCTVSGEYSKVRDNEETKKIPQRRESEKPCSQLTIVVQVLNLIQPKRIYTFLFFSLGLLEVLSCPKVSQIDQLRCKAFEDMWVYLLKALGEKKRK
jgi:hypothetical protein